MKWISVEDRLPEDMEDVLVYTVYESGGFVDIGRLEHLSEGGPRDIDWYIASDEFSVGGRTITDWMPLPDPPVRKPNPSP